MTILEPSCINGEKNDRSVPLLFIQYQHEQLWISPQHLPILIHNPSQLVINLTKLEFLGPAED
jgi:hypothetical protein